MTDVPPEVDPPKQVDTGPAIDHTDCCNWEAVKGGKPADFDLS